LYPSWKPAGHVDVHATHPLQPLPGVCPTGHVFGQATHWQLDENV
jgi:hypothetical protein